jgi:hypothetical protein
VLVDGAVLGFVDAVVLVDLGMRGTERRDLDDLVAEAHVRQVEAPADQAAVAEDPPDLLRVRVGGDVEVLGLDVEQQVAHGAAHEEGLVTGVLEPIEHLERGRRDVRTRDRVVGARVDRRLRGAGRNGIGGLVGGAGPEEFREREQVISFRWTGGNGRV